MPHLIIEYSANLSAQLKPAALLSAANQALLATGEIAQAPNLKSRALACADFQIGDGSTDNAFVHARLHLLSGRSEATQQRLCQCIVEALAQVVKQSSTHYVEVTAEAIEMSRDSYVKSIVGG